MERKHKLLAAAAGLALTVGGVATNVINSHQQNQNTILELTHIETEIVSNNVIEFSQTELRDYLKKALKLRSDGENVDISVASYPYKGSSLEDYIDTENPGDTTKLENLVTDSSKYIESENINIKFTDGNAGYICNVDTTLYLQPDITNPKDSSLGETCNESPLLDSLYSVQSVTHVDLTSKLEGNSPDLSRFNK